jgi:hypothetical protein
MRRHCPIALLAVLLAGCGNEASSPKPARVVRRQIKSGLIITCGHVVVGPELICGVLTARNTGTEPIAVIDRWNSWGAYQWRLTVGAASAENPQSQWWANAYTEALLVPGETRHAWFTVTRSRTFSRYRKGAWGFLTQEGSSAAAPSFAEGQRVTLRMDSSDAGSTEPDRLVTTLLWTGLAAIQSKEFTSLQDLEGLVQGPALR